MTPAVGFFDGHCTKCDEPIGWAGTLADRPPCPRCGDTGPTPESIAETEAVLDRVRAEVIAKREKEWAERTPEQVAAHTSGFAAYVAWQGEGGEGFWLTARNRRCEAWKGVAGPLAAGLVRWFNLGWQDAEAGKAAL